MVSKERAKEFYEKYKDVLTYIAETIVQSGNFRLTSEDKQGVIKAIDLSLKRISREKKWLYLKILFSPLLLLLVLVKLVAFLTMVVSLGVMLLPDSLKSWKIFLLSMYYKLTPSIMHGFLKQTSTTFDVIPVWFISMFVFLVLSFIYPGEILSIILSVVNRVSQLVRLCNFQKEICSVKHEVVTSKNALRYIIFVLSLLIPQMWEQKIGEQVIGDYDVIDEEYDLCKKSDEEDLSSFSGGYYDLDPFYMYEDWESDDWS